MAYGHRIGRSVRVDRGTGIMNHTSLTAPQMAERRCAFATILIYTERHITGESLDVIQLSGSVDELFAE